MRDWSLKHVRSGALARDLKTLAAQDHEHLAKLLAHIGEFHARKLYREAAQPHMYAYCINVLHFSEDAAGRRIHVAGVARRIPALFDAIAEGRVNLTGACLIAAHLTPENAERLLAQITHKTKEQIQVVIAALKPKPDLAEKVTSIAATPSDVAPVTQSAQVVANVEAPSALAQMEVAEDPSVTPGIAPAVAPPAPRARVIPLAPERYGIQFTGDQETRELLEEAKELQSDPEARKLENIFKSALKLYVRDLHRRKHAKTDKPRAAKRPKSPHTITNHVRQQVWERDQGQCTFVNEDGRRCPSRGGLEFDHARAKGRAESESVTTAIAASDVRLLCRAHNQLMAERLYGVTFMQRKRDSVRMARAAGGRAQIPSSSP